MPLYQAIVLAIVQGLTEFLPISSTAHLTLFPWLLHWQDPGLTFDIALHAGTLLAVLVFFWREWVRMLTAAFGLDKSGSPDTSAHRKLFWLLVVGTIPGGLAGALGHARLSNQGLSIVFGSLLVLAGISELTGWMRRVRWGRGAAWIAGALSGVLGGLVGNQGGIRTASLLGFDVPKESFVATATAIALFVDGAAPGLSRHPGARDRARLAAGARGERRRGDRHGARRAAPERDCRSARSGGWWRSCCWSSACGCSRPPRGRPGRRRLPLGRADRPRRAPDAGRVDPSHPS